MNNLPTDSHEEEKLVTEILAEKQEIGQLESILHHEKEELHVLHEKLEHIDDHEPVTVKINNLPVIFIKHVANGLEIKETAIAQHISIQLDFNLFEKKGEEMKPIRDNQVVHLHRDQEFRAVAPDDNSQF